MTNEVYHTEAEKATVSHGLRVAPAIVGSLWDAGCAVLAVGIDTRGSYIQVYGKEQFIEWLRQRGVTPKYRPATTSMEVYATVDGIVLLDFMPEDRLKELGIEKG